MSVSEFRKWYWEQPKDERSQLAELAAEQLGCELGEETDIKPDADGQSIFVGLLQRLLEK